MNVHLPSIHWNPRLAIPATIAAGAVVLLAVPTFASGSSPASSAKSSAATAVHIDYFYGETTATSGSSAWQWITNPDSESFSSTTSRGIVTGTATLGSSNGAAVSGELGVCYQSSSGAMNFGNYELITFTAPAGTWVPQTVSGTIIPANTGQAPGTFKVGLCVQDTSSNLTYDTAYGALTGDVLVAETSAS